MPCAVADVDEGDAAEIAHAVHPAEQHDVAPTSSARSAPQVWVRVRSTELFSHNRSQDKCGDRQIGTRIQDQD